MSINQIDNVQAQTAKKEFKLKVLSWVGLFIAIMVALAQLVMLYYMNAASTTTDHHDRTSNAMGAVAMFVFTLVAFMFTVPACLGCGFAARRSANSATKQRGKITIYMTAMSGFLALMVLLVPIG